MYKLYFSEHFLDFSLYGSWEGLVVWKRLRQGPSTISTPGKPNYENVGVRDSPERDILSLGTLGDGGWPGWGVLLPAPSRPWPGPARPGHFEK